jgi:hypothetical protein
MELKPRLTPLWINGAETCKLQPSPCFSTGLSIVELENF